MRHDCIHLKEHYKFLGANGADPTLNYYLPFNMTEMEREHQKRPCILICPGGGYGFCSQRESEATALHFLPQGFNAFILTYSTEGYRYPTQIREVAAALELIYENAEKWNCDTTKIALMGFSAGGHLAASYVTKFDTSEVRELFPESKQVKATILSYPVITADMSFTHQGSILNLLGHEPSEEEVRYHSCDQNVNANTPPAFIWHTASDKSVPVANSLVYAAALAKYNIPVEMHIFPFGEHGLSMCNPEVTREMNADIEYDHVWIENMMRWLKRYFL